MLSTVRKSTSELGHGDNAPRPKFDFRTGYPTPKGFPLQVPQDIVFGDAWTPPHVKEPSREDVDKAHAVFVEKLTQLFDAHKAAYGYPNRKLEII